MQDNAQDQSFELTIIAETGDQFNDFAPYVASINAVGQVAFQAGLTQGGTGVFCGSGNQVHTLVDTRHGPLHHVYSHPAIDCNGAVSVYAELASGHQGLVWLDAGGCQNLTASCARLHGIGPLGPTMNDAGMVAFRADDADGQSGVYLAVRGDARAVHTLARTHDSLYAADGCMFSGFHGLPVLNRRGQVIFRADLENGLQGIFCHEAGAIHDLVITGRGAAQDMVQLAPFPMINDHGVLLFGATQASGRAGIFMLDQGSLQVVVDSAAGFHSVRGALINQRGMVVYYATPEQGELSIYYGPDPVKHRLLGIGDVLFGDKVLGFALNPVSVNEAGQIAIRLALDNGRGLIVRADPAR